MASEPISINSPQEPSEPSCTLDTNLDTHTLDAADDIDFLEPLDATDAAFKTTPSSPILPPSQPSQASSLHHVSPELTMPDDPGHSSSGCMWPLG
jgi:hypothetical protein